MYRYIWKIELNNDVKEEDFINHWRTGSAILQTYMGALGTHIHEVRGQKRAYFAVAEWESQTARDSMMEDAEHGDSEQAQEWRSLPKNESFGRVINFAGAELDAVLPN
jgi:hypothetical protein